MPKETKSIYLIVIKNCYSNKCKVRLESRYMTKRVRQVKLEQVKRNNYYGKRYTRYLVQKIFNGIDWMRDDVKLCKCTLKQKLKAYFM